MRHHFQMVYFPVQFEKNSAPNISGISGKGGKRKKGKV